ncbi:MJ1244 family protein [Methanothermococcus okinawensis]|uniref:Nitrogen regulatory protein P-II n=1 Tax=Methanothermococcus okinawensis (strain DSM 14208 / JCM 11175 / IH1) TaxID=647113 RepID=F8ANN0_METOI|nr:MJ1244 family protein [Methanothermococcus okinawensis]AEH06228.1 Protein of unknown function, nitrogen regulatory protein PII-related protein [Methanothermococcus okinawensis IH1]
MKVLLYLFVETENVGKAINALSEGGISGFFLNEYKGMSPQDWSGFLLDEEPEKALKIINDMAHNAVMIGTIVNEKNLNSIKKCIHERLSDERYTIAEIPIVGLKVNRTD